MTSCTVLALWVSSMELDERENQSYSNTAFQHILLFSPSKHSNTSYTFLAFGLVLKDGQGGSVDSKYHTEAPELFPFLPASLQLLVAW